MHYSLKYIFSTVWLFLASMVMANPPISEPNWDQHDSHETTQIDHRPWQQLLKRYVYQTNDGTYLFRYGAVTTQDKARLSDYWNHLQSIPIHTYSRNEQLAYWINLYNATLVRIILDHYPVDSITSINPSHNPFDIGPFSTKVVTVLNYPLSLHDINRRILYEFWRDPRINFALCTGAVGSPSLRPTAYQGKQITSQLERATHAFINSRHGVNNAYDQLNVSKLFFWFKSDFGNYDTDIIRFIQRYAEPSLSQEIEGKRRIWGSFYDWGLNG